MKWPKWWAAGMVAYWTGRARAAQNSLYHGLDEDLLGQVQLADWELTRAQEHRRKWRERER